ncbi:MAG: hypothetical protein JXJ22_17840 [Bacteroidales bacterium]|nr:hypothetical protein [Bacteroidales bacterium]
MNTFSRFFAVSLLVFLGIGGIYGGWVLLSDPGGNKFQWSLELLEGTPFKNFLIPGIILFIMNGLLPLAIALLGIVKAWKYKWLIILQGIILIGWLTAELLFNSNFFWPGMHYSLYSMGIIFIVIGIILLKTGRDSS